MIRVLIVDDHSVVRRGMKQILMEQPDMAEAGEAGDGCEAIEKIKAEKWDVVMLDISMPRKGGLETLKEIKVLDPKLPVLILSVHPEEQLAVRFIKAGASGYLNKETAPEELIDAIHKVVAGGKYISRNMAEKMAFSLGRDIEKLPHELLSEREYQVFCMIAAGKTPSLIAQELNLSVKTISTYRVRILEKMGMTTNSELIHYAIQNNLVI